MKIRQIIRSFLDIIHARFRPHAFLRRKGMRFGKDCRFYCNVYKMISTEPWAITLGDRVHITVNVRFVTHDGGTLLFRDKVPDLELTFPIRVGNDVYIGVDTILLPGVTIGDNVIIGAGSVVTKDCESGYVYAGNPAKKIKTMEEYFEKAQSRSQHLGHLKGKEKDLALRKFYGIEK